MRALVLPLSIGLLAFSCGKPVSTTPSYLRDIQPLLERSCLSCHRQGSIAPVVFDTPETAHALAASIWSALETRRMPPFYASAECNTYRDDPRFTPAELDLVRTWFEAGAPIGDKSEEQHAVIPQLPTVRHDITMSIGADYDVRTMDNTLDNYRCFPMDPMATEALMVTGYEVTPGNVALVHHVLAYEVLANQIADLQALDDGAPGPGYPCKSGSVGIDGTLTRQIAGWVPGAAPDRLPVGSGLHVSKGSKIVIQIHYNLNALSRAASPIDQTKLALEIDTTGMLKIARILPMLNGNLDIAAYDKNSVQTDSLPAGLIYSGARFYALMGHMHQLGTEVKLERLKGDGTTQCMIDIKGWDFNWQRTYRLEHPITLLQDDSLRITCIYDNSQENQATINGVQVTPRRVQWGESSFDEMCMTYMTFVQ